MATTADTGTGIAPRRTRRAGGGRWRRYILVALGLLALVGVLVALKGAQIFTIMKAGKRSQAAGPPPETVSTFIAASQTWNETIDAVGTIATARGVTISNDASGIVARISFESGETVHPRQVLAELDTRVERAQLESVRARKKLAAVNAERTRTLFASGSIAPAQMDADESQLAAATADEGALLAQIERKIVRAPFAGKLGIRLVNVGQYLAPGTPITVLESDESNYVDFTLPQQDTERVAVGMPVQLSLERGDAGAGAPRGDGKIYAVEPALEPTTRSIKLRATIPSEDAGFRPGMFVRVSVLLDKTATVVVVPGTAIVHAPYGDSVFIAEPAKSGAEGKPVKAVRQQFVRVGRSRGDFAAITNGISPGDEVVTAGAFKLRNRALIVVNNEIDLHPELTPHPMNR